MNFRDKKGSVAVYALLSLTIFIAFLFSLYIIVNARHKNQLEEAAKIKQEMRDYNEENNIEIVENADIIDLHLNGEYNDHINQGTYVYIREENKIYKFHSGAQYINEHVGGQ